MDAPHFAQKIMITSREFARRKRNEIHAREVSLYRVGVESQEKSAAWTTENNQGHDRANCRAGNQRRVPAAQEGE
jgi:hypothetical protein